ncbi:MAG TPA: hypothetical protein VIB79_30055 [Candidatus Binatia bacterium]|jgi:hypothetical protein
MAFVTKKFFSALSRAGLPDIPREFSVVPHPQLLPRRTVTEIDEFIRIFDRVTTRASWQDTAVAGAPEITRQKRPEVCFFTAWDFHLSPEQGWQLIECNDNGSGFFFAALINSIFYDLSDLRRDRLIEPPAAISKFENQLTSFVEREAEGFFTTVPGGLFLILETAEALSSGKFRLELKLLRDLFRRRGWRSQVSSPDQLSWHGGRLQWDGQEVSFIVNRCTDFFWQDDAFSALRTAYQEGAVYVAPNPFTYATRSDKRLLEFFSLPDRDKKLGIEQDERRMLGAHVPPTYLLRESNIEEIANSKGKFFFKPAHGFAGHGVLTSSEVGIARLRRLIRKGEAYVAQTRVPKPTLQRKNLSDEVPLWTDLRVWAYRGERFLVSGRASRDSELLDLNPPGGWLPTFIRED